MKDNYSLSSIKKGKNWVKITKEEEQVFKDVFDKNFRGMLNASFNNFVNIPYNNIFSVDFDATETLYARYKGRVFEIPSCKFVSWLNSKGFVVADYADICYIKGGDISSYGIILAEKESQILQFKKENPHMYVKIIDVKIK